MEGLDTPKSPKLTKNHQKSSKIDKNRQKSTKIVQNREIRAKTVQNREKEVFGGPDLAWVYKGFWLRRSLEGAGGLKMVPKVLKNDQKYLQNRQKS